MSKPILIRKNFNGGEITPELHYRSELDAYHKSCKTLKNMLVTPWGAAIKRPPTELLAKINTNRYGIPVKYVPFRFSLDETFHIVFTDGSGSVSPSSSTADMIVFDADGNMQTLESASTKILSTVYDPDDLSKLHHIQVNDFIYMTCGGKYPVQTINRYYDEAFTSNRWTVDEFELELGPFDSANVDSQHTVTLNVTEYDASSTYDAGDVVTGTIESGSSISISQVQWMPLFGATDTRHSPDSWASSWYACLICDAPHGLSVGDTATLDSCNHSIAGVGGTTNMTLDGNREVIFVLSDYIFAVDVYAVYGYGEGGVPTIPSSFNVGSASSGEFSQRALNQTYDQVMKPVYANVTGSLGSTGSNTIQTTFVSQQNGNTGNDLTDSSWWVIGGATEGVQTASVTISSNEDTFETNDVGRLLAIRDIADERLYGAWEADQTSQPVNAYGNVTVTTEGGAWGGLLELQQSTDDLNTWETIGSIRSENGGTNGSFERTVIGNNAAIRVRLTDFSKPTGTYETEKCVWNIEFSEDIYQVFEITSVDSTKKVNARPVSALVTSLQTSHWKLGEFSEATGYPYSLTIHDERMVFGGTPTKPNTVWASRVNDWNNFIAGSLDVSPYTFTIKSDSFDSIRWLRSTRQLMIGTENSETTMGSRDNTSVISPTNIDVRTHTYFGSSDIQAIVTADLVFFVQGQGKRVRSTSYDFASDQYLSNEMSIFAHHITQAGIKEMSFRRHPYSTIFFVLNDGKAVSFTYERDNQVRGWSTFETDGTIITASSNYSATGDIIAGIVKRVDDYYLETFGTNDSNTVFLDSQTTFTEGLDSGVSLSAYGYKANLVVVDDDETLPLSSYDISSNILTLSSWSGNPVTVGIPFESVIEPTDVTEFGEHGSTKRATKLALYLQDSGDARIYVNGRESPFTQGLRLEKNERLNDNQEITVGGGYDESIEVKITSDSHKPFNLLGIGYRIS